MEHSLLTFWDSVLEGEFWIMLGERFKGGVFKMKLDNFHKLNTKTKFQFQNQLNKILV